MMPLINGGGGGDPAYPTYRVQAGDTLSGIALRFGTTVKYLLQLNPHITDPDFLVAGDILHVPGAAPVAAWPPAPVKTIPGPVWDDPMAWHDPFGAAPVPAAAAQVRRVYDYTPPATVQATQLLGEVRTPVVLPPQAVPPTFVKPAPVAPTPAQTVHTYRIRPGDNLTAIAVEHGTTIAVLMQLNPHITDPDRIFAGDTLHVPSARLLPYTPREYVPVPLTPPRQREVFGPPAPARLPPYTPRPAVPATIAPTTPVAPAGAPVTAAPMIGPPAAPGAAGGAARPVIGPPTPPADEAQILPPGIARLLPWLLGLLLILGLLRRGGKR